MIPTQVLKHFLVDHEKNGRFPECSLNVPWMFPECPLNVPWF
jgi:hypothetical protein